MAGEISWGVPRILKTVYENRSEIIKCWKSVEEYLSRKKGRSIAFTGLSGIGKTVLFDYLTGAAYKPGYTPPHPSGSAEAAVRTFEGGKRLRITVVPGDDSRPRLETLDSLFAKRKAVIGVVHVVANGFVDVYQNVSRETLINDRKLSTIEKFTKFQRKEEIKDLDKTLEMIRRSMRENRRPTWMMIAVTKIDLYADELDEAERYYSPHSQSSFSDRMKELQSQVGSDNFRWETVPVCSWLENFDWNGETRASTIETEERDAYLAQFAGKIESYNG